MTILLKSGTVLDYASNTNDRLDILIEDDKIVQIQKNIVHDVDKFAYIAISEVADVFSANQIKT